MQGWAWPADSIRAFCNSKNNSQIFRLTRSLEGGKNGFGHRGTTPGGRKRTIDVPNHIGLGTSGQTFSQKSHIAASFAASDTGDSDGHEGISRRQEAEESDRANCRDDNNHLRASVSVHSERRCSRRKEARETSQKGLSGLSAENGGGTESQCGKEGAATKEKCADVLSASARRDVHREVRRNRETMARRIGDSELPDVRRP